MKTVLVSCLTFLLVLAGTLAQAQLVTTGSGTGPELQFNGPRSPGAAHGQGGCESQKGRNQRVSAAVMPERQHAEVNGQRAAEGRGAEATNRRYGWTPSSEK